MSLARVTAVLCGGLLLTSCSTSTAEVAPTAPVRVHLGGLAEVTGYYVNRFGHQWFPDDYTEAHLRIGVDGTAEWTRLVEVYYADYGGPSGLSAAGPFVQASTQAESIVVRDGAVFARVGGTVPLFLAYRVPAAMLPAQRVGEFVPAGAKPSQRANRTLPKGQVLVLVAYDDHGEFERLGAAFPDPLFNIYLRLKHVPADPTRFVEALDAK